MGRKPSPCGYSASRYNRMTNGVMIHDLMPSRGLERCPLSDGCPCWDGDLQDLCIPGRPCPWDSWFLDKYLESGRENYKWCLQWLTEDERDSILHDLAILSLRKRRLSDLVAKQGLLRPKVHPVSGVVYGVKETVGIGRYATAISRLFHPLFEQLVLSPEERAERDKEEASDDGPPNLVQFREQRAADTHPSKPRHESFVNPTADWFVLNKPWEHQPGSPPAGEA